MPGFKFQLCQHPHHKLILSLLIYGMGRPMRKESPTEYPVQQLAQLSLANVSVCCRIYWFLDILENHISQ
jgi:hypothetical protein